MLKKAKQVLVVFLAFLMLLQTFEPGLRVFAYDMNEAESNIFADINTRLTEGTTPMDAAPDDALWLDDPEESPTELTGDDIIGELVHLREANVKHFRMSDGSFIAVTYDTDVHFQDADGYWVDIDNSLTLDVSEDVQVTAETERLLDILEELLEQEEDILIEDIQEILEELDLDIEVEDIVFTTEDTMLDIHFNLGSGCEDTPDFVVEHEGYAIGLSLIGAEEQVAEIVPIERNLEDNSIAAAVQLPNLTNRIIYRDILPGVDLEYVLHGHDIKENIIVNHLLDSHTFFFELDMDNLRPIHHDDGSISLMSRDTDEEVFLIPAPFMWDADGEFSTAVRYEIVPAGSFHSDDFTPEVGEYETEETPQEDYEYALDYPDAELDYTENEEMDAEAFSVQLTAAMTEYETEALDLPNYQEEIDPSNFPEIEEWDYENADKEDRYLFVVIVDEEWMHDAERVFPVTIDPPIVIRRGEGMSTSFVRSRWSNTSAGPAEDLFFGYSGGYSGGISNVGWAFMYLRINDLPQLPDNSIVVHANVQMWQRPNRYDHTGKSTMHVPAYALTSGPLGRTGGNYSARGPRTGEWLNALTWDTRPTHNNIMLDYATVGIGTGGQWAVWNITGITQEWYDGLENFGLAFVPLDHTPTNASPPASPPLGTRANVTFANQWSEARPTFVVHYRNTAGLLAHHTYATQGLGRAGTGYVGDFTGQLTVIAPIAGNASATMPFSLSMIYNSAWAGRNFTYGRPVDGAATQNTVRFDNMRFGPGWKPSALQTIVERRLPNVHDGETLFLVYLDADGTEHYFAEDEGYFRDEDGLGLRIRRHTGSTTCFTMYDDQNNRKIFRNHILSEIIDRNENHLRFIYNTITPSGDNWHPRGDGYRNNQLRQIRQWNNDGSGNWNNNNTAITLATLNYHGIWLTSITDRAENVINFSYSGVNLTGIQFPDGISAYYRYDYRGRIREAQDGETGRGVTYYWGAENQIVGIHTFATGEERVTLWRNGRMPGITRYRHLGPDRISNTADDLLEYVIFDHAGRTVNYYITDYIPGSTHRNVLGASVTRYTHNVGTDRQNNRVTATASIGVPAVNLLRNSGMESGEAYWIASGGGVSISPQQWNARTGTQSQHAHGTGAAFDSAYRQSVNLVARTTYTFSAYVNTSDRYLRFVDPSAGVRLEAMDGGTSLGTSTPLNFRTDPGINDGWQRISVTFTAVRTGAHDLRITYRGFTGVVRADDFQLEVVQASGGGASNVNLVQNGGFETGALNHWGFNGNGSIVANPDRQGGPQTLRITGHPARQEFIYQDVPIRLTGETFVLSGWAKALSIPLGAQDDDHRWGTAGPTFGMVARITYRGGATEDHHLRFHADVQESVSRHTGERFNGWQFASIPIVPRQINQEVYNIRIYVHYNNNANVAWFDNISLVREAAQTFRYDADGNLESVTASALRDTDMEHDENNNLIRQVTRGHGTFHYTYDDRHNLTQVISGPENNTDAHNLMMAIVYNDSGVATSSTLTGHARNLRPHATLTQLVSSAAYTADGHLLTSSTDVNGITRTLEYHVDEHAGARVHHEMRGIPARSRDGRGNYIHHRFDFTTGRPTSVFQEDRAVVNYYYDAGNLSRIQRGGFLIPDNTDISNRVYQTYNFSYNAWGQMTEIALGNLNERHVLKTYDHNADHTLRSRTYANNHTVYYYYDFLGRATGVRHSDGTKFTYTYTGDGQLHSIHDSAAERLTEFTYDTLGRLVTYAEWNADGTLRQGGNQRYDDAGRVVHFAYDIPSIPRHAPDQRRYAYMFDGETGNLSAMYLATNQYWRLTYEYDHLHRVAARYLRGSTTPWVTRFDYYPRSGNDTSLQVRYMTQEIGREALRFRYWYDSMGQITQWRNPVRGVYQHYEYDAQNQLIRETHLSGQNINTGNNINGEFIYEYDTFGNIRRRTHRNAANVVVTTAFSYDYDLWPDLLTAVDGNPITYDRSGNPLRWHDGTEFTWTRGRQLIHAQNPEAGLDVSFTYDQDGIRTGKTVERNGVITEHTFYTQNGRLVGEVRRNANGEITDRLEFIYDEAGRPIQMIHNGNPFNYVLNLQGDVLQLRCAWTGENVAAYVYNAWGHLLIAVGRMAEINPLRYRGYVFCSSLGMYYLQSRYYDPWIGRFINADAFVSTGQGLLGFNMFAYCLNNPVNLHDPSGYMACACGSGRVCTQNTSHGVNAPPPPAQPPGRPPPVTGTTGRSVGDVLDIIVAGGPAIAASFAPAVWNAGIIIRYPEVIPVMRLEGLPQAPGGVPRTLGVLGFVLIGVDAISVGYNTHQQEGSARAIAAGGVRFALNGGAALAGIGAGKAAVFIPVIGPVVGPAVGAATATGVSWGLTEFQIFGNTIEGHINNGIGRVFDRLGW